MNWWTLLLLTDCRNETAPEFDAAGRLRVMSWHIHYTTNTSDQRRFYEGFADEFGAYFSPDGALCPFGPNYGSESYPYVCSLEAGYDDDDHDLGEPWSVPQRAFFVPRPYLNETWGWAQANQGGVDLFLHPNTGCMYDDHGTRGVWRLSNDSAPEPEIYLLEFPCNMPGTGCNDSEYPGPPSCGCQMPVASDAPEDSCLFCEIIGGETADTT